MTRPPLCRLLLGTLLLCVVTACAPASGRPTTVSDLLQRLRFWDTASAINQLRLDIAHDLAAQHPESALLRIRTACAAGHPENAFAEHYPATINAILDQADTALVADEPAKAGMLYRTAREGFPATASLAQAAQMPLPEIDRQIDLCADTLMQHGLRLYRSGQLDAALDTWDQIAAFHPEHRPSQIAIKTTRTQLHTLRQIAESNRI